MEPLREYLDRRERELIEEIATVHAAMRDQLRPKEAELAEVRRAMASIGMTRIVTADFTVPVAHGTSENAEPGSPAAKHYAMLAEAGAYKLEGSEAAIQIAADRQKFMAASLSAYEHLTMKQLIVKALSEHFHGGAAAQQLRDFFRDAWGRNIERANLSPQLSRLRQDGVVEHTDDGRWRLALGVSEEQLKAFGIIPPWAHLKSNTEGQE